MAGAPLLKDEAEGGGPRSVAVPWSSRRCGGSATRDGIKSPLVYLFTMGRSAPRFLRRWEPF